ncbi:MAG: dTDP-4-dehydrorhamnose 3,5-epimerase [Paracoccaceae bacterium]
MLDVKATPLPGVMLLTPGRFGDARGWFSETWNAQRMADAGLDFAFVQDNHSFSAEPGTLRGLHFQKPPRAQDKLMRCTRGAIFDVAVDVRRGSATFGHWTGAELSAENGCQLLVPKGFLHGFVTLVADTEVQYKCTDVYAPDCDGAVLWSSCGIDWPLPVAVPILSDKDRAAQPFADFDTPFDIGAA